MTRAAVTRGATRAVAARGPADAARRHRSAVPGVAAALVAALLAAGCTAARQEIVQPRDGRAGLQGTGTLEGRQVAVAQGVPVLTVGDCDPGGPVPDGDVCIVTDTVDGRLFVLTFENPAVLGAGTQLPVGDPDCGAPPACDDVAGVAIVTVKLGTDDPVAATGGSLRLTDVEPSARYAGEVTLELPTGSFSGGFDVVPRPED